MRMRAMGSSVSTMSNWAVNVMISQVSPIGLQRLGWKFCLVFICTNLANGLIVILFFPETKEKTLKEMNEVFGEPKSESRSRRSTLTIAQTSMQGIQGWRVLPKSHHGV
ncbi:hypothetical protein BDV93DRAFT_523473, partial [Ceratobasidium sp. AG-I]